LVTEISVIGTGGGYGESIIVSINHEEYIIIDSCYNPSNKEILPIKFFESRGISFDKVKLIVCTHWHDDHINGLSQVLELCVNSKFSFAKVNDVDKFFHLVTIDYGKNINGSNSSTVEFNKCIRICKNRGINPTFAHPDRLLYSNQFCSIPVQLFSLSPSDYSTQLFDLEIAKLIKDLLPNNVKLVLQTPNDRSVALLLKVGDHSALFGADLEVKNDRKLGWFDILDNSTTKDPSTKSSYFKIPHHGSENGFHNEIWQTLLVEKPVCTLTPYNKKVKLPTDKMAQRYLALTKSLFITSDRYLKNTPKQRDSKTSKVIKEFNSTLSELRFKNGIITSIIDLSKPGAKWETSLSGSAHQIT
jgi:beta-lactamase superfamily II metal-dependent hydrolase